MNGAKVCLTQVAGGVVKDKVFLSFAPGDIKLAIPPGLA